MSIIVIRREKKIIAISAMIRIIRVTDVVEGYLPLFFRDGGQPKERNGRMKKTSINFSVHILNFVHAIGSIRVGNQRPLGNLGRYIILTINISIIEPDFVSVSMVRNKLGSVSIIQHYHAAAEHNA